MGQTNRPASFLAFTAAYAIPVAAFLYTRPSVAIASNTTAPSKAATERRQNRAAAPAAGAGKRQPAVDAFPDKPFDLYFRLMHSDKAGDRPFAIAGLRRLAAEQPAGTDTRDWIAPLTEAGDTDDLGRLSLALVLKKPGDSSLTSDMQDRRVQILLSSAKYDEALVEAKVAYNVAALKTTPRAAALVAEALRHSLASPGKADAFAAQQSAELPQTKPNILAGIYVDPAPYAPALARVQGSPKYDDLIAAGNLLLLSDRPTEARAKFASACQTTDAKGKKLFAAIEGIARAIRAADGSAMRANQFLLSLASGEIPPDLAPVNGLPAATDLVLAGKRISHVNVGVVIDAIQNGYTPANAVAATPIDDHKTVWDPADLGRAAPQPDAALIDWLEAWREHWAAGEGVQAGDRNALQAILKKTTEPTIQLFQIAHAIHMRGQDELAIPAAVYDAASRAAERELAQSGHSPASTEILHAMNDHMADYKAVLWPLRSQRGTDTIATLERIYSNFVRWMDPEDKLLARSLTHVRIGLAECQFIAGGADVALRTLDGLDAQKMTGGERMAYSQTRAFAHIQQGEFQAAVPYARFVAESGNSDSGWVMWATAVARTGNLSEARSIFDRWVQRFHPSTGEARDVARSIIRSSYYTANGDVVGQAR